MIFCLSVPVMFLDGELDDSDVEDEDVDDSEPDAPPAQAE